MSYAAAAVFAAALFAISYFDLLLALGGLVALCARRLDRLARGPVAGVDPGLLRVLAL